MRLGIAVDSRVCMACYCCFTACKDEHCGFASKLSAAQPMMGQYWIDVREWGTPVTAPAASKRPLSPPCAPTVRILPAQRVAKNGAVYKRPDGIVIIDPEKIQGPEGHCRRLPHRSHLLERRV